MRYRKPDDEQAHVLLIGNENGASSADAVVTELNRGPVDDRLKRLVRLLAQQAAEEFLRNSSDERRGH